MDSTKRDGGPGSPARPLPDLASWRSFLPWGYALVSGVYLFWRFGFTLNREHLLYSAAFLAAEALGILSSLVLVTLLTRRGLRPPARGPLPPFRVDVFIATYNEEVDLVRCTAVAARDLEYPHQTWICDDGRRPEIAAVARELGVGYLTRPRNEHHKAGNLNHALSKTAGDLVLVLDADHVCRPHLLRRLVGYFRDPGVALVQTPQVYYNLDSFQHACAPARGRYWHESAFFHHRMQPGADELNAAVFVGTGALLRRSALEVVGGFATGSVTEDVHTSMRLHAAGYRSVYVDEPLGYLLAPDTLLAYACQRLRWAQGALQILRCENPLTKSGLSPGQRAVYFTIFSTYLAAYAQLLFFLAPATYLFTGVTPIDVDPAVGLPIFTAHLLLNLAILKVLASPHFRWFLTECYKVLNLPLFLRASAALVRPRGLPFRVTPKGRHRGLPLWVVLPCAGVLLVNATALGVGVMRLAEGQLFWGTVLYTMWFAGVFAAAAVLALVHACERRSSDEAFTFPVSLRAPLWRDGAPDRSAVVVKRLSRDLAYAVLDRPLAPGTAVEVDLAAAWVPRAVRATVVGFAARKGPPGESGVAKIAFADLSPPERDAIDRFLFQVSFPHLLESATRSLGKLEAPRRSAKVPGEAQPDTDGFLEVRFGIL